MVKKTLCLILGYLSLGIGILGIFIPGLPTTPLLLLSAWFFARGSRKVHERLMRNRVTGFYIRSYHERGGMTRRQKALAVALMWGLILLSVTLQIDETAVRWVVAGLGAVGTAIVGFFVPSARK